MRQSLKEKKIAFKRWRKSGLEANRKEYNAKEAKRSGSSNERGNSYII